MPSLPDTARTLSVGVAGRAIRLFARLVTAPQAIWAGCAPEPVQRIYYANHTSHGDLVLLWTSLPATLRRTVRPVAGADYWLGSRLRRFVGCEVLGALLVDRRGGGDPVADLVRALDAGSSLVLFPEGTRNTGAECLQPFRSGLYHVAAARPDVELVPVWLENLNRVLPKGEFLPVPLLCRITFGTPLRLTAGEERKAFLARAEAALLGAGENPPATVDAPAGGRT